MQATSLSDGFRLNALPAFELRNALLAVMIALISLVLNLLAAVFKSKSRLEAENAALRQQLIVLQRKVRGRVRFSNSDRLFFVQLYRWFPSVLAAMRLSGLRRWCGGTVPGFAAIGAGSLAPRAGGRRSARNCGN
ncbi:MAG: hypothetical protein WBW73_15490 [Rhodoplanes sp.]